MTRYLIISSPDLPHRATRASILGLFLRLLSVAGFLAVTCASLMGQASEPGASAPPRLPALSESEIVQKMVASNKERAEALKHYSARRRYDLEYSGFPSRKHADMVVEVNFKAPHEKQLKIVSEEGSELLRSHVLHKLVESEMEANGEAHKSATALNEENYRFTLLGTEHKDGRDCYRLQVEPRNNSKFLYKGTVWIDGQDFAVVRIEGKPSKSPSFWTKNIDIEHQYAKFGPFWLPVANRSVSSTRFGGRAVLAIDYGPYRFESATESIAENLVSQSLH